MLIKQATCPLDTVEAAGRPELLVKASPGASPDMTRAPATPLPKVIPGPGTLGLESASVIPGHSCAIPGPPGEGQAFS